MCGRLGRGPPVADPRCEAGGRLSAKSQTSDALDGERVGADAGERLHGGLPRVVAVEAKPREREARRLEAGPWLPSTAPDIGASC